MRPANTRAVTSYGGRHYDRVDADRDIPSPPGYLSEDIRDEFVKIVMDLQKLKPGLVMASDRAMVIAFARTMAMYNNVCKELEMRPMHTRTLHGELRLSPYALIFMRLNQQIMNFSRHFGLSPLARARMPAPPNTDDNDHEDDLDELFSQ